MGELARGFAVGRALVRVTEGRLRVTSGGADPDVRFEFRNATADVIFPYVSEFEKMNEWTPWALMDPDTQYVFSGPEGVGRKVEWTSEDPNVGTGSQRILELRGDEYVKTHLDFGAMGTAVARFDLVETGGKTNLTWKKISDIF